MAEPRRTDPLSPLDAADRDGRIEGLLVEGLDHYFTGRYENAIHVWTRVLFLDRSHARARAYIDRARTALAERQRRSDEMLEASQDLLDRGHTDAARHLLGEAVAVAGDDERAAALRLRLERLERVLSASRPSAVGAAASARSGMAGPWIPRHVLTAALLLIAATALVGFTYQLTDSLVPRWLGFTSSEASASRTIAQTLVVPGRGEVGLIRARNLYSRGRLAEALQVLDRVAADSPLRSDADQLRVEIQRLLLAAGPARATSAQGGGVR
jgi:tetratricopeptide (TPR) repeat protein